MKPSKTPSPEERRGHQEGAGADSRAGDGGPKPGGDDGDRQQERKLGLDDQQPENHAREKGPPPEHQRPSRKSDRSEDHFADQPVHQDGGMAEREGQVGNPSCPGDVDAPVTRIQTAKPH